MDPTPLPALQSGTPTAWEEAIYAFLVEKRARSGSTRTVESYARMVWPFFAGRTPDRIRSADVLAFAHVIGLSGRVPSAATVGARIACLSSFYRFAIRMGLLAANPCDALERPRTVTAPARGYGADEVRRLLAVVPDTVRGRRDRAILLVLLLTGRRRAEVFRLCAGDLNLEGETVFYRYRGKGGKAGRRELPRPAHEAICATLADVAKDLATMDPDESLWQAGAGPGGITSGAFAGRFRRVPGGSRPRARRAPHPPPHCRETPSRCRGVDRGRERVPRPLITGGHDGLPASARGRDGRDLARGRAGHRRVRSVMDPAQMERLETSTGLSIVVPPLLATRNTVSDATWYLYVSVPRSIRGSWPAPRRA
ncbi:MAG: tyrosine-type recombinase/integrase [Solirubrobacterales bacterium]